METYSATLKGSDPLYPDYYADSLSELYQTIASNFYESDRPAIVNLSEIIRIDNRGREFPLYRPLTLSEARIEGLIQDMYLNTESWASMAHSSTSITL